MPWAAQEKVLLLLHLPAFRTESCFDVWEEPEVEELSV